MHDLDLDQRLNRLSADTRAPVDLERRVWTRLATNQGEAEVALAGQGIGTLIFGQLFGWQGTISLMCLAALIGFAVADLTKPVQFEAAPSQSAAMSSWVGDVGPRAPSSILGE